MKRCAVVLLLLFAVFALMTPSLQAKEARQLRVVMIIAQDGFQDHEFFRPKKVLEDKGIKVVVASSALTPAKGMLGAEVQPEVLVKDVSAADYDAVVYIGGSGASQYWTDESALALARSAMASKKIVAAICIAPVTLAKAGIITGRKVTAWPQAKEDLEKLGVRYTGVPVERDGNIITASGPDPAEQFGEAIASTLLQE